MIDALRYLRIETTRCGYAFAASLLEIAIVSVAESEWRRWSRRFMPMNVDRSDSNA